MLLRQTQTVLANFAANSRYGFGGHIHDHLRTGVPGLEVGEVEFDPAVHEVEDIMVDSLMEGVTGVEHVATVLPLHPMNYNIVVDETKGEDHPVIAKAKGELAGHLENALENSKADSSDHVAIHYVGNLTNRNRPDRAERIDSKGELLEVCRSGLTFVISDFNRFYSPFMGEQLDKVVAVKINHTAGMRIPANIGVISLGGALELNTGNARKLETFNNNLNKYHAQLVEKLSRAGFKVAQVVATPVKIEGFDIPAADKAIAEATKCLR